MTIVSDAIQPPGDVMRRLADLERQVAELRAARGLSASEINSGNLVVTGGTIKVVDPAGHLIAQIGFVGVAAGKSIYGIRVFRATGAESLFSYSAEDGLFDIVGLKDQTGHTIVADDAVTQQGLATPYLSSPLGMSWNGGTIPLMPGTTSNVFTGLWEGQIPMTHPRIRVLALVGGDDGATAGEARMVVAGVAMPTLTVPAGAPVFLNETYNVPGWRTDIPYLAESNMRLEVRRTAGAGRMVATIYSFFGKQS